MTGLITVPKLMFLLSVQSNPAVSVAYITDASKVQQNILSADSAAVAAHIFLVKCGNGCVS